MTILGFVGIIVFGLVSLFTIASTFVFLFEYEDADGGGGMLLVALLTLFGLAESICLFISTGGFN